MPDSTSSETELKLEVARADLDRLRSHPLLKALGRPKRLVSAYYDTPDLKLRDAGLSLRIRQAGAKRVQTLKTAAEGAGLMVRGEWESPLMGEGLDLAAVAGTPLADLLKQDELGAALAPRFSVEVERASSLVSHDGSEIELTIDDGAVEADGRRADLTEVEFELKTGQPRALFDAARELFDAAPLRLSARSKSETGYDLLADTPSAKATDPKLHRRMSTAEAFQAIGRACLGHFLKNERLVRTTGAPEAVHQARVGLRRLRAAMSVFKPLLGDADSERLEAGLKQIADALGHVRDLDVLLVRLRKLEVTAPFDRERLVAGLQDRRAEALAAAAAVLAAPESARLAFEVSAWLEAGEWSGRTATRDERERSIADYTCEELHARARKLRKELKALTALDVETRHKVRIRAKKVRYASEFFTALAKGKRGAKAAKRFVEQLRPLQESLGELNDVANAERALRLLAERNQDAGLAFAAGEAADAIGRTEAKLLEKADKAAKGFARAKAFLD